MVLLHPFIPFFTEKVWQDFNFSRYFNKQLMLKEWNLEPRTSFNISHKKISWLIDLVSNIRSTKVNLNVSPGSFVDVSTSELSSNKAKIIENNLNVLKRLGRVSNVSNSKLNNNAIKIIVKGETVILYFDQNIDLKEQKQKIDLKIKDLNQKLSKIGNKLKNKSFMKNAPKQIVENEKKALIEHKIELKKLNSIINSIKN